MKLWHHQQYTYDKFKDMDYGFDASDPGTGKTASAIALYARRAGRGRALVLCPSTLMESAWGSDLDRFFPELTYTLAYADRRMEAFEVDSDVVIMNVDGIRSLDKKFKTPKQRHGLLKDFDHLIIDEIESYKHPSSQRSRAMNKWAKHFNKRFGLSATPNPQSVVELWHPSLILDHGKRLGTSYTAFRNGMQEPIQTGPQANHITWHDKPQAIEIAHVLLDDMMVRHAFEEVMTEVPPNHTDTKFVALPPKVRKVYTQLEQQATALLESGERITVTHASSLRSKLLQACSGAMYNPGDEDGDGDYVLLDNYRYELIADLVDEREHSVVFFNWRHQRDELVKALKKRGLSFEVIDGTVAQRARPGIVAQYQNGEFRTLLVNYKTGAHGLTLTRGTTSIIASPIYEPNYFKQTVHRIYRGGQTQVTNTLLVCARDTVEELVYEKLKTGTLRMEEFLRLVQDSKQRRD